jgi:uncharacterized protein (UPF0333 family)
MAEEDKKEAQAAEPAATPAAGNEPESLDTPGGDPQAAPGAAPTGVGEPKQAPEGKGGGIKSTFNVYFLIFIVVVLAAVGIIYYAVSTANKSKPQSVKTQSLTSAEIAQLKGNTTLVGDTKSTLDVQSNAVFEGQVLVRNDLSTAGSVKVGTTASIKDLVVSGTSTLGNVNISGTTQLSGDTSIQGALSILKGINVTGAGNFASLNVGQLTVNSIQLSGDFNVSRHITTGGNPVTRTPGTALGGGGTASVSGNDTSGTVTINTGNTPLSGLFATVKFARPFATTPRVIITPIGSAASLVKYYVNRDNTGFSIGCSSAPPAGSSFAFDYFVIN